VEGQSNVVGESCASSSKSSSRVEWKWVLQEHAELIDSAWKCCAYVLAKVIRKGIEETMMQAQGTREDVGQGMQLG
jgi:hypothetical protein